MATERGGGFRGRFTLATGASLGAALAIYGAVADAGGHHDEAARAVSLAREYIGHGTALVLAGACFGIGQWLVLRRYVRYDAALGMLASVAGLGLGVIAGSTIGGFPLDFLLGFALLGAANGLLHWRLLRGRAARAGRLVAVEGGGFLLGGGVALALIMAFVAAAGNATMRALPFPLLVAAVGAVAGTIGAALAAGPLARALGGANTAPAIPEHVPAVAAR